MIILYEILIVLASMFIGIRIGRYHGRLEEEKRQLQERLKKANLW